jgi:DNA-binding NarL/FixJ family response regulator
VLDVLLVHRYRLPSEAIVGSLRSDDRIARAGAAHDRARAIERLRTGGVDVALVDASLGRSEVRETIREIKELFPSVNVLYLGSEGGDEILESIEAGASGYVSRQAPFAEMLEVVEAVSRGRTPCSPRVAASVSARIEKLACQLPEPAVPRPGRKVQLTLRETEVLQLVARGMRNKEIAQRLDIKLPTVKNHVHKILEKFQVKGRRRAIRAAFESGLLDDPLPRPAAESFLNPHRRRSGP